MFFEEHLRTSASKKVDGFYKLHIQGLLGLALEVVPDCFKTQKMCNKAADAYPFTTLFVADQYKT